MADWESLGWLLVAALAETAGAAGLGWWAGRRLARLTLPLRVIAGAGGAALALAVFAAASYSRWRASDLITALGCFAVSAAIAPRWARLPRRRLGRVAKGALAILVGLEIAARLHGSGSLDFLPAREKQVLLPERNDTGDGPYISGGLGMNNRACNLIYSDRDPRTAADIRTAAAGAPHIALHVADSLMHSVTDTGRDEDLFSRRLPAPPGWRHVLLGRGDTGPDAEYLMVRSWLSMARADLVVWYFDVENDLTDVGLPYACCELGPLLDFAGGVVRPSCPAPRLPSRARLWLANSGPPAVLRLLARGSRLAGSIALDDFDHPSHDGSPAQALAPERRAHFAALLKAMRDMVAAQGGRLVVTAVPDLELLNTLPDRPKHRSVESWVPVADFIAEASRKLGIPFLDLTTPFAPVEAREGRSALFGTPGHPENRHFTALGHERLASVVGPALAPFLPGAVWPPELTSAAP